MKKNLRCVYFCGVRTKFLANIEMFQFSSSLLNSIGVKSAPSLFLCMHGRIRWNVWIQYGIFCRSMCRSIRSANTYVALILEIHRLEWCSEGGKKIATFFSHHHPWVIIGYLFRLSSAPSFFRRRRYWIDGPIRCIAI